MSGQTTPSEKIDNETVSHCAIYLREFASFLYETIEDKEIASVMSVAMSKASVIVEDLYYINTAMAHELRNSLKNGSFDEDGVLRILTEWKKYVD